MFRQIANTMMIFLGGHSLSDAGPPEYLSSAGRILFMGDSITHAGHYIIELEAQFRLRQPGQVPEMINLGLPSETCSGLSEPDHPFPRPDVHERLERALEMTKPDVVVACYGMNDGIYYPFSQDRFAAYQDGVQRLIQKVRAIGAPLILMSPPPFDPEPLRKKGKLRRLGSDNYAWFAIYEGYDDVLERYAAWLMQPQKNVEMVIDLHTPVKEYTTQRQAADPGFSVSPDGVHLNEEGHRVLANTILQAWGMGEPEPVPPRLLKLVAERQRLLHDAWLSHVGHKRPDVPPGLPLNEALQRAAEIEKKYSGRVNCSRSQTDRRNKGHAWIVLFRALLASLPRSGLTT